MLKISIASDHGGYELKQKIVGFLSNFNAYQVTDLGPDSARSVDYPDYAIKVVQSVLDAEADRGILICGTGIGMSMMANRFAHIRAAVVFDEVTTRLCREHNDANILCLGARMLDHSVAIKLSGIFLSTPFSNEERHGQRIAKLDSRL